jgi:hypothetical protein
MRRIGIDSVTYDFFEFSTGPGYSLWPAPMVSVAAFVEPNSVRPKLADDLRDAQLVFREDSFDPVARIRRGRFYVADNKSRPSQQDIFEDPAFRSTQLGRKAPRGTIQRDLFVFDQYQLIAGKDLKGMVAIGAGDSLWRILTAERIVTGEHLVTLQARHALGVLPDLEPTKIPDVGRAKAIETYEKLADAAYRESPGSTVDRARDAAQWFLATNAAQEFSDPSLLHKDLAALVKEYEKKAKEAATEAPTVLLSAARIFARLHSRGKPNEQEKRSLRPVMESDAEFALAAIGLMLRELDWAR